MKMNSLIGIVLLVGGIALLVHGMNASHSASSQTSYFIVGRFTVDTIWYIIGGAVATLVGMTLVLTGFRGKNI